MATEVILAGIAGFECPTALPLPPDSHRVKTLYRLPCADRFSVWTRGSRFRFLS